MSKRTSKVSAQIVNQANAITSRGRFASALLRGAGGCISPENGHEEGVEIGGAIKDPLHGVATHLVALW
jgi:hypothetical protein